MPAKPNSTQSVNIKTQKYNYQAAESYSRLDLFIAEVHETTRSQAKKLIKDGFVLQNGTVNTQAASRVIAGDTATVVIETHAKKQLPDIETLFEDDAIMVINKPYGVLVHSTDTSNEATVADLVVFEAADSDRPAIVHRLDRTTSGVMVLAKNLKSRQLLLDAFKNRKIEKSYIAICEGVFKDDIFDIDLPIGRHPTKPQMHAVNAGGRASQTRVTVLARSNSKTLLHLMPRTGRTHQLRVHMAYLKKPIVGDGLYGSKVASRVMLHAYRIKLPANIAAKSSFMANLEENMKQYIHDEFDITESQLSKLAKN